MERVPHRNELEPPGGDAGQLQRHADGGRAAGRKANAPQVAGGEFTEPSRQCDGRFARVAPGAKRKGVELLFDRGNNPRMAEADLMNVVAVEIEVTTALDVLNPRAMAGLEGGQAGGGKGLM